MRRTCTYEPTIWLVALRPCWKTTSASPPPESPMFRELMGPEIGAARMPFASHRRKRVLDLDHGTPAESVPGQTAAAPPSGSRVAKPGSPTAAPRLCGAAALCPLPAISSVRPESVKPTRKFPRSSTDTLGDPMLLPAGDTQRGAEARGAVGELVGQGTGKHSGAPNGEPGPPSSRKAASAEAKLPALSAGASASTVTGFPASCVGLTPITKPGVDPNSRRAQMRATPSIVGSCQSTRPSPAPVDADHGRVGGRRLSHRDLAWRTR